MSGIGERAAMAVERIEATILPHVSHLLDGLLDSASLARPGTDADQYATELRYAALQAATLTRLLDAVGTPVQRDATPRRMSA